MFECVSAPRKVFIVCLLHKVLMKHFYFLTPQKSLLWFSYITKNIYKAKCYFYVFIDFFMTI